jgi:hypothetical protein
MAHANSITVLNPSFETLPAGGLPIGGCGVGCSYSESNIPDWTGLNNGTTLSGQIQPGVSSGNTSVFFSVPDGLTVGYVSNGMLSQVLSASLVAGLTYTLQVDVGLQEGLISGNVGIELLAGTTVIASADGNPTAGNWVNVTAAYTSPVADPLAGEALSIVLFNSGAYGVTVGDFDNVRLGNNLGSSIPEPASSGLAGLALVLIAFVSRKRKITA